MDDQTFVNHIWDHAGIYCTDFVEQMAWLCSILGFCDFRANFLLVDIFYQDLSSETIKQNVAFELLSLFSEIGGFLGLLLGASAITVCELLDYLSLMVISKIRKNKVHRIWRNISWMFINLVPRLSSSNKSNSNQDVWNLNFCFLWACKSGINKRN